MATRGDVWCVEAWQARWRKACRGEVWCGLAGLGRHGVSARQTILANLYCTIHSANRVIIQSFHSYEIDVVWNGRRGEEGRGLERRGWVRRGWAWSGRHGMARSRVDRHGEVRLVSAGKVRQGIAWRGQASRGMAWQGGHV